MDGHMGSTGHAHDHSPSMSPTPYPWTQERRDISMITGYSISLLNRAIIGSICLQRLWQYHNAGVLLWKELKVRFHVVLLLTVPICSPYFGLCLDNYDMWQCYADKTAVSEGLYRTTWFLYSLYRVGLSLQLICLSMTVLTWSDFLSYVRRDARVALTDTPEHKKLVRALLIINGIDLTISLLVNGFIALYPTEAEGASGGDLNFWVYLNWLFLDVMQLALVSFLLFQGERMMKHIGETGAIETSQRLKIGRQLRFALITIVICVLTEIVFRLIASLPLFFGKFTNAAEDDEVAGDDDYWTDHEAGFKLYRFVENWHLVWQFACYILPYDVVSFCLLYLMRAPPRKRVATFRALNDSSSDRDSSNNRRSSADPARHSRGSSLTSPGSSSLTGPVGSGDRPLTRASSRDGRSRSKYAVLEGNAEASLLLGQALLEGGLEGIDDNESTYSGADGTPQGTPVVNRSERAARSRNQSARDATRGDGGDGSYTDNSGVGSGLLRGDVAHGSSPCPRRDLHAVAQGSSRAEAPSDVSAISYDTTDGAFDGPVLTLGCDDVRPSSGSWSDCSAPSMGVAGGSSGSAHARQQQARLQTAAAAAVAVAGLVEEPGGGVGGGAAAAGPGTPPKAGAAVGLPRPHSPQRLSPGNGPLPSPAPPLRWRTTSDLDEPDPAGAALTDSWN